MTPYISIVTICKNAIATIERTLASVSRCDYPRLQYIVVDGGSTDGTREAIQRHGARIDKFVSEPDGGISDALNKAVGLTDGDYHLVVHADDALVPESLAMLVRVAGAGGGGGAGAAKVICGSVLVVGDRGVVRKFDPDPRKLTTKMSIPHMGSLISKDAWTAVGGYDLRRRIAMDHLLMLRILNRFGIGAFSVVDAVVAHYHLGGVSDREIDAGFRELRDNLTEEGVGRLRANATYVQLMLKSRVARLMRGS